MTTRGARAARGTAVAVFATLVASLAHTVGGGTPPGPIAVMVALAFSAPLAMALTGARAKLLRTAVSALASQAALHLCYAIGGAAPVAAGASAPHAAHGSDAMQLATVPVAASVDHGHAWMPVAHVVAAALTLVALALGDRVLDALGRVVHGFARRLTTIPARVVAPSLRLPADAPCPRFAAVLLESGLGSRGPPIALAAA